MKDKAGRELWHLNVVSEIWASTVIIILNQQLPVLFNSKFRIRKKIKIFTHKISFFLIHQESNSTNCFHGFPDEKRSL